MTILGKSRGVAAVLAAVIGLASVPAAAQMAPTGLPAPPPPPPPAKPAAPAAGAQPTGKPAAPAAAPAKPVDPKAAMAAGEKKFKAGDFAGALTDFEAANAAKASPEGDRFIGLSHDNLGHFTEAVAAYERFLANVPAAMKAQGEETKKRVEAIKAMPGKLHLETTPAGAQIFIDSAGKPDAVAETATTPTDVELKAGRHSVRLTAEGYDPFEKDLDVAYGAKVDLKIELVKKAEVIPPPPPPVVADTPAPAPTPPAPPPSEPRSKVPAYVTGAVAIVATGVGIGFGIKALGQSSDFDKPGGATTKRADDGENNALVADMMFGIAITFGVTSAVLFLSSDAPQTAKADPKSGPVVAQAKPRPAPAKITVTPAPYVTPTGGGAGALIRF